MSIDNFLNKTFTYMNVLGDIFAEKVTLLPEGELGGYRHYNESSWSLWNGNLCFLDENGDVATNFSYCLELDSRLLLFGSFRHGRDPSQIWHILWEEPPLVVAERTTIQFIDRHFRSLQQTINLVSRDVKLMTAQPVTKALFLVHNMAAWDSIADLIAAMGEASDFHPIVAAVPGNHYSEVAVHNALEKLKVPHIRPFVGNEWEALDIIKSISPSLIFKQTPWEKETPDSVNSRELNFSRLCYIPYYGFNLVDSFDVSGNDQYDMYSNQPFHRVCWMIFAESEDTAKRMRAGAGRTIDNIIVAGHPKLDRLHYQTRNKNWPIDRGQSTYGSFKIVWAPHWSISGDWLSFGTFLETHHDILQWVREDPSIEVVLKPHPGLFSAVPESIRHEFLNAWNQLENTSLMEGGDYGSILAASDAMITDGISFLAEYQIFDRPLIYIDSLRHAPFNDLGKQVVEGAHVVTDTAGARFLIDELRRPAAEQGEMIAEVTAKRRGIAAVLRPYPGEACTRILDAIRLGLQKEE
ncbi:CDP-glycerol glycerophosphotransferase family protein [Sphingobium chungangianum]